MSALAGLAARSRAAGGPLIAALALALVATLFFALNPLGVAGDYPNHLARVFIEWRIAGSASLQQFYEVRPQIIPDLAMDLLAPPLAAIAGIYGAGAILAAVAAVIAPLAGFFIARHVHGPAAASWLPLAGFMALFNINLEFGFVNFLLAAGAALFAFLFWLKTPAGWRRVLLFAPVSLALVVAHALGFLLFGYLVLLWELASWAHGERGTLPRFVRGLALRDAFAFAPGLLFLALSMSGAGAFREVETGDGFIASRLVVLMAPFRFHAHAADSGLVALLAAAVFALGLAALFIARAVCADRRLMVVALGVVGLALAIPEHVLGIWGLHLRFPAIAIILIAASLKFRPGKERWREAGAIVLAVVVGLQFWTAGARMAEIDATYTEVRAAARELPEGARILPAYGPGSGVRVANHAAAFAVIEAKAFVPTLFTNTSPVGVRPEWRPAHLPGGVRVTPAMLNENAARQPTPAANGEWSEDYYVGWPANFTHIIYMRAPGAPPPAIAGACPQTAGATFVIYVAGPCAPQTPS